jgi:opacity protein-like surface antigen
MKKFLLLAASVLLLPVVSSAQSKTVSIGVKGGLNLATFGGSDASQGFQSDELQGMSFELDPSTRTAFVAGAFISVQLDDYFALQPELLFVSRGVRYNGDGSVLGFPYTYDIKLGINYLEIPVLAKLTIPTGTSAIPFVYAGPSLGLKMGKITTDGKVSSMGQEFDLEDEDNDEADANIKSTDVGVALGAGLGLNLGGGMLSFDARYTLGLTNIMKPQKNDDGTEREMDIKNRSISLTVGFSFFL